jgi:hypothetical protein
MSVCISLFILVLFSFSSKEKERKKEKGFVIRFSYGVRRRKKIKLWMMVASGGNFGRSDASSKKLKRNIFFKFPFRNKTQTKTNKTYF